MSSGKLAYLSKYTDGEKKKKKKKKKRTKDFDEHDNDYAYAMPTPPGEEDDEDEGPTVVTDIPIPQETTSSHVRHRTESEGRQRRRRYDSDDDDVEPPKRRARHDSDDEETISAPRRRYDSDDDDQSKPRRRYDSDDDEPRGRPRRRYDSDDDEPQRKSRRRYDSDDDSTQSSTHREKMSSGHSAGLQRAEDFREAEATIQKRRKKEAQEMVDRHGMGQTVYRDEEGRKVDSDKLKEKKTIHQLDERESALLNKGRVQKEKEDHFKREWQDLQKSSFARHEDDEKLEDSRRDVIREGDPMAQHAARKKAKAMAATGKPTRPVYKGPAPKPNRFGIKPGYRWDGVDRGNGFEEMFLARKASVQHKKEQAYRWSSAEM